MEEPPPQPTLGSGTGLTAGMPADVGMSSQRLARLEGIIQSAIEKGEAPGAVLLVARRGRIVYFEAFGERARWPSPEPMTTDTIFDMASLTKVMATATSIMMLVEEGSVALSDRVVDYLPEFGRNGKEDIRLRDLLTHYSGLRPDVDLDEPWQGYETAIELAYDEELRAPPGRQFIYSDINYFVLAEVVRVVSGLRIDEYSRRNIFLPLEMRDTQYNPPPEKLSRVAPSERRNGEMLRGEVHDPTTFRMGGVAGHAGLFSTARDTAIFAQFILNGGEYDGVRILSPLSILQMTRNQAPPGQGEWRGYGFDIDSRYSTNRGDLFAKGSVGHTGFTGTSLWIDPATQTFVILLTSRLHPDSKGNVVGLRKRVASIVAASIMDATLW